MTKIVIDARQSGTSTGRYIDKLIECLHKLKPAYGITVLTKSDRTAYLKNIAPDFEIIETPYEEFSFGEQLGFKKQLDELKPDLVHFGMVQQPIFYHGKVVTSMHDLTRVRFGNPAKNWLIFKIKQFIYRQVNKIAAHKSAAILTDSNFVKHDIATFAHINGQKITVTYLAADIISDAPEFVAAVKDQPFIMYVGRPQPHKNLGRLIDAFALLKQKYPDLKLVLAGKKDVLYQRIGADVAKRQIQNVVFTDFVSEGQLRWLYEHCKAYVFPSLSEGFGLPGLEAMVHGAPVVSSNATCLPEIYGQAAHYFNPLDTGDMAAKIGEVLDSQQLREKLITAGYEQVKKYSWQRMAEQTLEIYKKILNEK